MPWHNYLRRVSAPVRAVPLKKMDQVEAHHVPISKGRAKSDEGVHFPPQRAKQSAMREKPKDRKTLGKLIDKKFP